MNKNRLYKTCKVCVMCESELIINFNIKEYNFKDAKYICIKCLKEKCQLNYINKKDHMRQIQKDGAFKKKLLIIKEYGGKCVCCGEDKWEFLSIDHINNNGAQERKDTKQGTGEKLYRWFDDGYC